MKQRYLRDPSFAGLDGEQCEHGVDSIIIMERPSSPLPTLEQIERQIDRQKDRYKDGQIDRKKERKIDRKINNYRQIERIIKKDRKINKDG